MKNFKPILQPQPQPYPQPQSYLQFVILIVTFFISTLTMWGADLNRDSLKTRYKINDPRNPDCPCHLFQKIAEKEYAQFLIKVSSRKSTSSHHPEKDKYKRLLANSRNRDFRNVIHKKNIKNKNKRSSQHGKHKFGFFKKDKLAACMFW